MSSADLKQLWSGSSSQQFAYSFWTRHLEWLARAGFDRAFERGDAGPPQAWDHEVVQWLHEYITETGLVNAHLGLTSSDIVDNVRLTQCAISRNHLVKLGLHVATWIERGIGAGVSECMGQWTIGFTHGQPAAPLQWADRCAAWVAPLHILLTHPPTIFGKKMGGPVGVMSALRERLLLSTQDFAWSEFGLQVPNNLAPIQSSDHLCEYNFTTWCAALAAQLHKIAADVRQLCALQILQPIAGDGEAGSSAMPHKVNPFKFERVCSIGRTIPGLVGEVWDVWAHNQLERTLDTSWQLKRTLPEIVFRVEQMFLTMGTQRCRLVQPVKPWEQYLAVDTDRALTEAVLDGASRWDEYKKWLKLKGN